jgi:soluble lytic murein transglycosylase-like protein
VWGVDADVLGTELAQGRYASLATVEFPTQDPEEALGLSTQAPYYLSFVFDSLGRPAQSLSMLEIAWSRSPSPWKEEAGVRLAERYNAQKSWDRALGTAQRLLAAKPGPSLEARVRRAFVEALYWTKQDASVLSASDLLSSPDAEVRLFRAVSSLRLGRPQAHDLVMALFLDERVSSLHGRFAQFLAAEPSYAPLFSKSDTEIINGKNHLVQGEWTRALPLLEDALAGPDGVSLARSGLIADLGASYVYAGKSAQGGAFLEKLSARLAGAARTDALEQAGKLYRRARDFPRARRLLLAAAAEATGSAQRDRARWFLLDMLLTESPSDLASRVHDESLLWNDPDYFADLLEDRVSKEVAARRWSSLEALRGALADRGPASVVAQLDYVVARAWQAGRLRSLPAPLTARSLFGDALARDPSGYYGVLSASMLGVMPDRAVAGTGAENGSPGAALDPLAMGFLAFGLHDQAYARTWASRDDLAGAQLLDAAQRFASAGDLRSSLYLTGAVARRRKLTMDELGLYYPRGFAAILEPLAVSAGIPDHILFGLVREESYFDPDIVSSAGAVGLSQLMEATALPVAKTLKIANPDLTDPSTNLAIGVRHLRDLLRNVDAPTKALLAYNAGLSRVRQWERAAPGLPSDLFIESVPIVETRGYVRKILVSSVMYAFLYHDSDPRQAALSFFGITAGPLEPEPGTGAAPLR